MPCGVGDGPMATERPIVFPMRYDSKTPGSSRYGVYIKNLGQKGVADVRTHDIRIGKIPHRVNWDPYYLDQVKQSLSRHVGPIAGVLVDRTCKRVASRQQLYEALMTHIPSEKDRAKFLQSVPR